jgi:hypothetical protein
MRYFESCEEFYGALEDADRHAAELEEEAEEEAGEAGEAGEAYDPNRGGGFI